MARLPSIGPLRHTGQAMATWIAMVDCHDTLVMRIGARRWTLHTGGNDFMGLILTIIGVLLVILGVVQHFTGILGTSIVHLSLYIAIVGAVVLVIGVFMMMRGRSAAA
jgi:hypothetical protein